MKFDIILAGVGGQGVLSVAAIIARGAMKDNLLIRQSEVHGMSQRGGAVSAHLRLSDKPIASDLIGKGSAELILSMEPLESLRYLSYLKSDGMVITSSNPLENIPVYPDIPALYDYINSLPNARLIDAEALARLAGSIRATNMVMVGAASFFLPIKPVTLEASIQELFRNRGNAIIAINLKAFHLGREEK
ncbi:MAG: indolepyruvate oxidoreductase subunit beta [Spirochaetota bacterium]